MKTSNPSNTSKKTRGNALQLLLCLAFTAVFAGSLYLFHQEYIPWVNLGLVGLYSAAAMLAIGAMAALSLKADRKKTYTTKGVTVRSLIVVAVFSAILYGVSYYFNLVVHLGTRFTPYTDNQCAIRISYCLAIVMYGVLLMRFAFRGAMRLAGRVICVLVLIAGVCFGASLFRKILPTKFLYPVYRAVVPQGGVKTSDGGVRYDFAWATEKMHPTDDLGKDAEFEIRLAKNEREGVQLALVSSRKGKAVRVRVGSFVNAAGDEIPVRIYKERFVAVPGWGSAFSDEFPDALEPMTDQTVLALTKDRLQPVYIEIVSNKDTPAGAYTANCEILSEDGSVLAETQIRADVWDLTLPDAPATQSAMGIFSSEFWKLMGLDETTIYGHNGDDGSYTLEEEQEIIYKQYYDYLIAHHITPYEMPYDILDERADAYMSDPRVTSFCIPYQADDDLLRQYYEKVTSNPEWAAKGYFYPIDEPNDADAYARYNEITDRLARVCPGYNMVTPFYSYETSIENDDRSSVALQRGKSSILCPETIVLNADGAREELNAVREENGARVWWYVCCGPQGDCNNNFIRQDAIRHRILFWQEKMENVTGFLYWNSIYCDKGNPWETSKTWDSYDAAGDGVVMYPGRYAGYDEPVGTLRLKNLCDGIEDYTYLTLAEEKLGRAWIDERIAQITTSLTKYTLDDALLQQVRAEIGDALTEK